MADFEEIIAVQLDGQEWRSSLEQREREFDRFIETLNSKKLNVGGSVEGVEFGGVSKQIQDLSTQLDSLKQMFSSVFGAGEEAATESADVITARVHEVTTAAIASERQQTEAVVAESAKRTAVRTKEAKAWEATQKELKSAASTREARRQDAAALSARQSLEKELQSLQSKYNLARPVSEGSAASGLGFVGNDGRASEFQKRTNAEMQAQMAAEEAARQRLKSPSTSKDDRQFEAASLSARQSLEKELQSRAAKQVAEELKQAKQAAKQATKEREQAEREQQEAAEAESRKGISGFARGLGQGLTPSGGSAGDFGEFIGNVVRFQLAWTAVGVAMNAAGEAIKLPFDALKEGITYLAQMQETASQLKAGLLESVQFSDDPAKNMERAAAAAKTLSEQMVGLATKLNTTLPKIQTGFQTFSEFGGNNLTHNLGESLQVSAIATAALQAQNPNLPQRQVASELSKMVSGSLTSSSKLAAALGISADKLNEMAVHARTTHDLLAQIEAAAPGLVDRLSSADGRFDSLIAKIKLIGEQIEGAFSQSVFDTIISVLRQLGQMWDENKDKILAIGQAAGSVFGDLIQSLLNLNNVSLSPLIVALRGVLSLASQVATTIGGITTWVQKQAAEGDVDKEYRKRRSEIMNEARRTPASGLLTEHKDTDAKLKKLDEWKQQQLNIVDAPYDERLYKLGQDNKNAQLAINDPATYLKQQDDKKREEYNFWAARARYSQSYDDFKKNPQKLTEFIDKNKNAPAFPEDLRSDATLGFEKTKHRVLGGKDLSITTKVAKIKEQYEKEIKATQDGNAAFRQTITEEAKKDKISLDAAAELRKMSFKSEADDVENIGKKYQATVKKVTGTGDPHAIKALEDQITHITAQEKNRSSKGIDSENDKSRARHVSLDEISQRGQGALTAGDLEHDYAVKQEEHQHGLRTDAQAQQDRLAHQGETLSAQLASLQQQLSALPKNDETQRASLQNQIDQVYQKIRFNAEDVKRQAPYVRQAENNQTQQLRVNQDEAMVTYAEGVQTRDKTNLASPAQLVADQRAVLASKDILDTDKISQLTQALAALTAEIVQNAEKHGIDPQSALAANPHAQSLKLQIQDISIEQANVHIQQAKVDGSLDKYSKNAAVDRLLGETGKNGKHFGSIEEDASSLSSIAGNVSSGVNGVISGYQQGGIAGAVGSGLQTVGSFIPGPAGAVIGAIGSLTSMFSGLFTAAAQEIGREVAKAVDKIMEKYSTGQIPLVQAIQQVQQEINHLITSESGRKGGQQVIDNELPQLQQTLDSLKYQQQQEQWSFQDSTVEASSTNSVTQQWLTDWININKQVKAYHDAVGDAGNAQIAQYLNEEMQQQQVNLQNQYNQGLTTAINDNLQLDQLLQQRNNYEDQYRKQQFDILSADSLQRRGNPAIQAAQKLSLAKSQYNQETQQMNFQISMTQQKVDMEKQIFNLASDTANLQKEALDAQNYQLQQQLQTYQAIAALLADTAGAVYSNGSWNIPAGGTTGSGGTYGIPGTSQSTDNSVNGQVVNINVEVPAGMDVSTLATEIAQVVKYNGRIGTA